MDGALVGDFQETLALRLVEIADDLNEALDTIDAAGTCLALRAVPGVDFLMFESDAYTFERPLLTAAFLHLVRSRPHLLLV